MQSNTRSILFILAILILGAMLGTLLGELIGIILPEGVVKELFLRSISGAVGPMTFDLIMFSITFGFTLKLNFIGIIGLGIAYYILRYWR